MKHRDVGQRELGRMAGTYAANINRVIHGKTDDFSVQWAAKLADALGLQLWELFLDPVTFSKKFLSKKPDAA